MELDDFASMAGRKSIESDEAIAGLHGAMRLVRVTADHIFSNCPRYIPRMILQERSVYTPRDGYTPPDPAIFEHED